MKNEFLYFIVFDLVINLWFFWGFFEEWKYGVVSGIINGIRNQKKCNLIFLK